MERIFKQLTKFMFALLIMLCASMSVSAKKVHTIGDSTMAYYDAATTITRGWGMFFGNFLTNGWTSANYARGGRDARQGYNELWQTAKSSVEAGDYVIVQFAHNDEMFAPMSRRTHHQRSGIIREAHIICHRQASCAKRTSFHH